MGDGLRGNGFFTVTVAFTCSTLYVYFRSSKFSGLSLDLNESVAFKAEITFSSVVYLPSTDMVVHMYTIMILLHRLQ